MKILKKILAPALLLALVIPNHKAEASIILGLQGGWTSMDTKEGKVKTGDADPVKYTINPKEVMRGGFGELYIYNSIDLGGPLYVAVGPFLRYAGLKNPAVINTAFFTQKPTHSVQVGLDARIGATLVNILDLHVKLGLGYSGLIYPKYVGIAKDPMHGVVWRVIPGITIKPIKMLGIVFDIGYVGTYHERRKEIAGVKSVGSIISHGYQVGLGLEFYL